jgi:hypothetical protein
MRHGGKKEREKRRRTGATIVKKKDEMRGGTCGKRCSNRPQRQGCPLKKRCTNAPADGQVLQRMAREHMGKKKRESDGKSRPVVGRQQVMRGVKKKRFIK